MELVIVALVCFLVGVGTGLLVSGPSRDFRASQHQNTLLLARLDRRDETARQCESELEPLIQWAADMEAHVIAMNTELIEWRAATGRTGPDSVLEETGQALAGKLVRLRIQAEDLLEDSDGTSGG